MAELLQVADLEAAKKHDTFHSEVITGKAGGVAGGADIDIATNQVTGQVQKTLPSIINGTDWRPAGLFADGVTFTKITDFAIDANGTQWVYTGAYPFTATAGTVPSEPLYQAVRVNSLQQLSGLTEPSDLDQVHTRTFANVDAMLSLNGLVVGQRYSTGGTTWEYLGGGNTIDNFINLGDVSVLDFGVIADGDETKATMNTVAMLEAVTALVTLGGGVLRFPNTGKKYNFNKSIPMHSNISYVGEKTEINFLGGDYASPGKGYGNFHTFDDIGGLRNVTVKGFIMYCNRTAYTAIRFVSNGNYCADLTVDDCVIYDTAWDGVIFQGRNAQSGGNSTPWDDAESLYRCRVSNTKVINTNYNNATRSAFFFEYVHIGVAENCYGEGYSSGYHIEGCSDFSFDNCVGQDNNGDWQRGDGTNFGSDFLLGRSANLSLTNCSSRRYLKPRYITYPDSTEWSYKNIYMANPFMDGLSIVNFSAVGGEIRGNAAASSSTYTRYAQSFKGCNFKDCSIVFARQGDNEFFEGLHFSNCSFRDTSLTTTYVEGGSIIGCNWNNSGLVCLDLTSCKGISLSGNSFKGGDTQSPTVFRRSQLSLSSCERVIIDGNDFVTDLANTGLYSIGVNNGVRFVICNNTFQKRTENAIKEQVGAPLLNSVVTNNTCAYTSVPSFFTSLSSSTVTQVNNVVDGTNINKTLVTTSEAQLLWDVPVIASGASVTSANIVMNGVFMGQALTIVPPYDMQGLTVYAYVIQNNRAKIVISNLTGSPVDLGSGTWVVRNSV